MNDAALQSALEKVFRPLSCPDVVSVDHLTRADVEMLLELAKLFKAKKTQKFSLLKGTSVGLAFFESSTRTKSSFDLAGKNLGADMISVGSGTQEKKGENFFDVVQNIAAMNMRIIVLRTAASGLPEQASRVTNAHIINAGDGTHEHPSQALLDMLTISESFSDPRGKVITVIGDILHSRVFGSLARIVRLLEMELRVVAPYTLIPEELEQTFGARFYSNLEKALPGTDVVYALRVQGERGASGYIPTLREYSRGYGITAARLRMANPGAILMHPGPIQRDTDIAHELVQHPQSRIYTQVENGVAMRKALLYALASGPEKELGTHFSPL